MGRGNATADQLLYGEAPTPKHRLAKLPPLVLLDTVYWNEGLYRHGRLLGEGMRLYSGRVMKLLGLDYRRFVAHTKARSELPRELDASMLKESRSGFDQLDRGLVIVETEGYGINEDGGEALYKDGERLAVEDHLRAGTLCEQLLKSGDWTRVGLPARAIDSLDSLPGRLDEVELVPLD